VSWGPGAEEFLTNSLQKRLDRLTLEKAALESQLDREHEQVLHSFKYLPSPVQRGPRVWFRMATSLENRTGSTVLGVCTAFEGGSFFL